MKVQTTDSKVWWLVKADEVRSVSGTPIVQVIRRLVERFEFAQFPAALPAPNDGYHFQEGRFVIDGRSIAIKDLTIYNDGMALEIYSNTDDNLHCLAAVHELGKEMGLRDPQTPPNIVLQSMIVVDYNESIDKLAGHFKFVSTLLDEKIGIEGHHQLRVIEFAVDPAMLPRHIAHLNPTVFRLERRVNTDYDRNRFYSFANTTTENHLFILEKLEALVSN